MRYLAVATVLFSMGCGTTQLPPPEHQLKPVTQTVIKPTLRREVKSRPATLEEINQAIDTLLRAQEARLLLAPFDAAFIRELHTANAESINALVLSFYKKRGGRPYFLRPGGFHRDTIALYTRLTNIRRNGLDPRRYRVQPLRDRATLLKELRHSRRNATITKLAPGTVIPRDAIEQPLQLLESLRKHLPDTHERVLKVQVTLKLHATKLRQLDLMLVRGLFLLGADFGRPHLGSLAELLDLATHDPKLAMTRAGTWFPRDPIYVAMLDELSRQRKQLTLPKLEPLGLTTRRRGRKLRHRRLDLRLGKPYSVLPGLRERLVREGMLSEAARAGVTYDEAVRDALWAYQRRYGLPARSRLGTRVVAELNRSAETRVRQLLLGLKKHRESRARRYRYYIRVNIPAFLLELHDRDQITARHRVVVGNNKWDTDPKSKKRGRLNRTETLSSAISQLIVNPVWRVPPRIKENEIDKELVKDPDYLTKHNYKLITYPDGRTRIEQKPGPKNALGRVKFMFPNRYGIYIHDTPSKRLFSTPVRAYSHGCIRLHRPMKFAQTLLRNDQNIRLDALKELVRTRRETIVQLNTSIPILIEYNTVGLNEAGKLTFFSDIYGYDRPLLENVPLAGY